MRQNYKAEYIGGIKIKDIYPVGHTLELYLDNSYYPLSISADLPDEDFLEFIKQELSDRNLVKVKYYKAIRVPLDTPCNK